MASTFTEVSASIAATGATLASLFFVDPPPTSRAVPSARSAASARETPRTFEIDEAAFLPVAGPGRLRIASFNMLHVGARKDKDYERLARIVAQFDLCGVLELENERGLEDLTAALGSGWNHVISEREAGDPGRPGTFEFYGFVFRSDKVTPLDRPRGFLPDAEAVFSREPYFASFRAERFDFTMVLLHAEAPDEGSELTNELEHLPDVFRFVQDLDPDENDVLVAGDFNRSPSTPSGKVSAAWGPFLALPGMDCVIPDDALTSLSSHATGFANHYDEICFTHETTREFAGARGAFDFVAAMFEGLNDPAKKFVSDHLPVWAEFRTDQPDDDGVAPPAPSGSGAPDRADCCRICRTSKPCGDACIPRDRECSRPPGCACAP